VASGEWKFAALDQWFSTSVGSQLPFVLEKFGGTVYVV